MNSYIVLEGNDSTAYSLILFSQFFFYVSHIALDLTNDHVAHPPFFKLNNENFFFIFTNCKNINWSRITWVLLANHVPVLLVNIVMLTEFCMTPILYQKILKMLFKCKNARIFYGI